jgi:CMP-N-acetylneuraminic acid synthetase
MAKVKELVEEVRQEVLDLFHEYGVIPIEDVKQILKNEYFFQNKNNSYLVDENLVEELYNEHVKEF